jgi:T5SS/PEP-CTERM-associated repeat protein
LTVQPANPGNGLGLDVGGSFQAGYTATGYLVIEGGSVLRAFNSAIINPGDDFFTGGYNNIHIGRNVGGTGYALVTGAGSRLETDGGASRLNIGRSGGYGELDIENGGFVGAFNLTIGRDGEIGHINVDGAGSELKTSTAYGTYAGAATGNATGYNTFGRGDGGRGYLSVTNGGVVNIENEDGISDRAFLRLGRENGSYGYGIVSGAGSKINLTQIGASDQAPTSGGAALILGNSGQGKLIVKQGGQVNVLGDDAFIGIADQRSTTENTSDQSLLEVRSGGTVLVDAQGYGDANIRVGNDQGDNGKLLISGAGSMVTVHNDLADSLEATEFGASVVIGREGHGELYIDQGGKLIVDGADDASPAIIIGCGRGSDNNGDLHATGMATVTGAGSAIELSGTNAVNSPAFTNGFTSSGSFSLGLRNGAEGKLEILDGGRVSISGPNSRVTIGDDAGAQGLVTVDGAGSLFEVDQFIAVGMAVLPLTGADLDVSSQNFEADDVTSTSFVLSSSDGPLSLTDLSLQDFALRYSGGGNQSRFGDVAPGSAEDDVLFTGEGMQVSTNLFANDTTDSSSLVSAVSDETGSFDLTASGFERQIFHNGDQSGVLVINHTGDASYTPVSNMLAAGETLELEAGYETTAADGSTATADFLLSVAGQNDAPDITLEGSDTDSVVLIAGLAPLAAAGTLTLTDVDRTDTVSVSLAGVATGGDDSSPGVPDAATLAGMLALTRLTIVDNDEIDDQFDWRFKASDEDFAFLPVSATILLFYEIEAADSPAIGFRDPRTRT